MEEQKIFKTAVFTLKAVAVYREKNRETINQKAKDAYSARKNDPEFIEKRREYGRRFREKKRLEKNTPEK